MKKYLLLIFYMLSFNAFAQNPFYDAIYFKQFGSLEGKAFTLTVEDKDTAAFRDRFKTYVKETGALNNLNLILQDNPFLNYTGTSETDFDNFIDQFTSNEISCFGSLNVTQLADGLAKFLVRRTKKELNTVFFEQFYEKLKKYRDAQILFPQTYATLNVIGDQIYNYEIFLNTLKESFENDLQTLLPHIKQLINDESHSKFFEENPFILSMGNSTLYMSQELLNKKHPGDIIKDFPVDTYFGDKFKDVNGGIKTLQLISASIQSKNVSQYWIGYDSLKYVLNNDITRTIFLGLLYQQADLIEFNSISLQDYMHDEADNITDFTDYIIGFQKKSKVLRTAIQHLEDNAENNTSFNQVYEYYKGSLDLFDHAFSITAIDSLKIPVDNEEYLLFSETARSMGDLAMNIHRKKYASGIVNLYKIYGNIMQIKENTPDEAPTKKVQKIILKYGSFIAAVAQAENSDEVSQAIEVVALPAGSSRIKRESAFNISLNSYVGLFTGYERVKGLDNSGFIFNSYGVSAPVGVSFSRGRSFLFINSRRGKEDVGGWSSSVFISVIDIGALASFRFENDTLAEVPNIELKDIVAPGIFLSLGLPKLPLSINAGYQVGPILRKVTADVNEFGTSYSRFTISINVDIPIVNFYTRTFD